ncbi:MAG TPA: peptidylprolyl isomerase [Planctomycetota bacterium]|nr:peptidylprolyl isomerase [Planctomycetota bacterium]
MELQDTLIIVNGKKLKVEDVLVHLKATGMFRDTVCRLVEMEVLQSKCRELGVEITEQEFYEFAANKRRFARLTRAEDMHEYCRANGITLEQWHQVAKNELMLMKIRNRVVQEKDVADYFNSNRESLKTISLSRIVCTEQSAAKELKDRVAAGENFYDLARRYSVEEHTRMAGGYLGTVRRKMLPQKIEEVLFASKVDDVVGPIGEGQYWTLYRIDAVRDAELSSAVKKEIADRLFKDWMQRAIASSRFEKPR